MDTQARIEYMFPNYSRWWKKDVDKSLAQRIRSDPKFVKIWNEWFTTEEANAAEALTIFADSLADEGNDYAFRQLGDLSEFNNLDFLDIPFDAADYTDLRSVADKLRYLRLSFPRKCEYTELAIKKSLHFLEIEFPKLISLTLDFPPSCYQNFDIKLFPNLRWIELDLQLEKSAKSLKLFNSIESIEGMRLTGISKKDILNSVTKNLLALQFWDIKTRSFDTTILSEFQKLKSLDINGSVEIDAKMLADLPHLEELQLWNTKEIQNPECLLASQSLKRASIRLIGKQKIDPGIIKALSDKLDYFEPPY